jgi:DNA-binding NarL/FixJ family response regulator
VGGASAEALGRAILLRYPTCVVVLLMADARAPRVQRALAWGASAVLDGDLPASRVASMIHAVSYGDLVVIPRPQTRRGQPLPTRQT